MLRRLWNELADKSGRARMHHLVGWADKQLETDPDALAAELADFAPPEDDGQSEVDREVILAMRGFHDEDDAAVEAHAARAATLLHDLGEDDQAEMLHTLLGMKYVNVQEYHLALRWLELAKAACEHRGDKTNLARVLNNIGIALRNLGEFAKSLPVLRESVRLNTELGDSDQINSLNNLAAVYFRMALYSRAFETYQQALAACRVFSDTETPPFIYSSIANINTDMKHFDEAERFNLLALEHLGDSENERRLRAAVHGNRGLTFFQKGDHARAIEMYEASLQFCETLRIPKTVAMSHAGLGNIWRGRGELDKALAEHLIALEAIRDIGDEYELTHRYIEIAPLYTQLGEFDIARRMLDNARVLCDANDYADLRVFIEEAAVALFDAAGQPEQQLEHQTALLDLYRKELGEDYPRDLAEMQAVFDVEQKEKEAEIHRLKTVELQKRNDEITRQKLRLEKTLAELQRSEISCEFLHREVKDALGAAIIGESEQIRNIQSLIRNVANTPDTSVLITGETGVGKELVARAIHDLSSRQKHNFCAVNAASVPDTLFESEFFGYRKNAFTGADRNKAGWFEIADGGTLFLDEVGTWRFDMQAKFLRALESRRIIPVGGDREIPVDFRLLSAANEDLQAKIANGIFRADLYYRLASFVIHIPPLRERVDDIEPLLEYFIELFNGRLKKKVTRVERQVVTALKTYRFPGNVRELRNMVERAMIISNAATLRLRSFSIPQVEQPDDVIVPLDEHEKTMIVRALRVTGFHQARAAELLGLTAKSLERRMKKYGVIRSDTL